MDVIQVTDVSKMFRVYHDKGSTLKEKILFRNRNRYEDRWVLKDIHLNIKKGQTVGLIGENGSGKSTLLKLLTRIIYPNKGSITISGKVSSLLELGAGFHPDMTGKENIYMNASIFGLTKKDIDNRLETIIQFSELEQFIDNPVRTYSSGMYMRLAFSVAINVDPEILLIDEILAVGDANFQKKCMDRLKEFKKQDVTIAFVSHDLGSVEKICDRVVWLDDGKIVEIGTPKNVINSYMDFMGRKQGVRLTHQNENISLADKSINTKPEGIKEKEEETVESQEKAKIRWGTREIDIYDVKMQNIFGENNSVFTIGEPIRILLSYKYLKTIKDIVFGFGIYTQDGIHCFGTNTYLEGIRLHPEQLKKEGIIEINIKELNLVEGTYWLDIAAHAEDGYPYDYQTKRYIFSTVSTIKDVGICRLQHDWLF